MISLRIFTFWFSVGSIAVSTLGCKTNGYITSHVGTIVGIDISENPKTQVPHARFGYARTGMYYVPTGKTGETEGGDATQTPTLVSEIFVDSKFLKSTTISEKFAIGAAAVSSDAAAKTFANNSAQIVAVGNGVTGGITPPVPNQQTQLPAAQVVVVDSENIRVKEQEASEQQMRDNAIEKALNAFDALVKDSASSNHPVDYAAIHSKASGVTVLTATKEGTRSEIQKCRTLAAANAVSTECARQMQVNQSL